MTTITSIETVRCDWYPRPVWVQVRTDDGIVGLGETTGGPGAVEAVIHNELARLLIGRDALDIEGLHASMTTAMRIWRTRDAATRAVSALDVALWDIAGQSKDEPIWRMLGGKSRLSVPVYNTCASAAYAVRQGESPAKLSTPARLAGERWSSGSSPVPSTSPRPSRVTGHIKAHKSVKSAKSLFPPDDLQWFLTDPGGLAQSLLAEGFTGMKVWPFDQFASGADAHHISGVQIQRGLDTFRKIHDATDGKMAVAAELHSVWSLPAATRIVEALNQFDLMWVEDPVGAHDIEALAQVARISKNPVAASESLAGRESFFELFDRAHIGICMLDVCWVDGLTEARAVASMARAAKIPLTPHDCTGPVNLMAGLHLSIHAPNAVIQETVRAFNRDVYPRVVDALPRIERGIAYAPDHPGLGMKLRQDFLDSPSTRTRRSGK